MISNIFVVLCIALLPTELYAIAHHKGTISSFNIGARYSSLSAKRGVIFYNDFQIDPVLSVSFFDDRLEFLGDSLGYRDFIFKNNIRWRTQIASVRDNPRFPSKAKYKLNSPDRPDTFEWNNSLEIFFPGYDFNDSKSHFLEVDLKFSKDISKNHGNYFEILNKVKLGAYHSTFLKQIIEPNFVFSAGLGDSDSNQYYYGANDYTHGLTNISYGFWMAFPMKQIAIFQLFK